MVVKETMSVQRGLAELKLLSKRISDATSGARLMSIKVGDKPVTGYKNDEEFSSLAKAKVDSVTDLIKRRNAIKGAIIVSNAITEVKVGGVSMNVAQAIDRKDSIELEKVWLYTLRNQYNQVMNEYQRKEDVFKSNLDKQLETLYGKEGKAKGAENKEALKPFMDIHEPHLVDPLNLKLMIEELQDSINVFEMEVDFTLSESNVETKITIEY